MNATEAAWLAGFFDGDGNLNFERRGRRNASWRVRVRITNTNREAIYRVRELVGGGTIFERVLPSGRTAYMYSCEARIARGLLDAIEPYVVAKRERVQLAREAEAIRAEARLVSGGAGSGSGGHRHSEAVHERLAEIAARIRELNDKGPAGRARLANGLLAQAIEQEGK